jgi:PD-(D/E)XK nuclease superfamily
MNSHESTKRQKTPNIDTRPQQTERQLSSHEARQLQQVGGEHRQTIKRETTQKRFMLKVTSQLDDEVEALIHRVIGYCIRVHRELGPGLLERIYRRAVCIELQSEGVPFEVEKSFPVWYRGHLLCDQRVDIVVAARFFLK